MRLSPELAPQQILSQLRFVDCGLVHCSPAQRAAVDSVSRGVGQGVDKEGLAEDLDSLLGDDPNTQMINAASYTL